MPPLSPKVVNHDAEATDLPRDKEAPTSSPPANNQLDLSSAIDLWKTNPKLYIQQERQKTFIRTRDAKDMAAALAGDVPSDYEPKFPQFRKLPLELRLMIWEFSARAPRVVEFASCLKRSNLASRTSVPAILHVNREARDIGEKLYERISMYDIKNETRLTYIRWEVDVVLFTKSTALRTFLSLPTKRANPSFQCKNLAVRIENVPLLISTPMGPRTQLASLNELVLNRNKKRTDTSAANLILSGSPESMDDFKTVNDFIAAMRGHTLPQTVTVKWSTRKDAGANFATMEKERARREQYDSDLLLAAQLQEELNRRG